VSKKPTAIFIFFATFPLSALFSSRRKGERKKRRVSLFSYMTSSTPSSCCKGTGGCGSSTSGAGSGCAAAAADIDEPSSPMDSSKSPKTCARCPNPSDVSTSSFGSAALCSSCLREALRSRVGREAVDLRIKGQRVVVAWSGGGNWTRLVYFFRPAEFEKKKTQPPQPNPSHSTLSGPSSRLLAELLSAVATPASYPGARPSFELVAAVKVDCRAWRRLHSRALSAAAELGDASASTSTKPAAAAAAAASLAPTVVPIWLALAEEETEGLRRLELLHSSLEETGNGDDDEGEGEEPPSRTTENRRRRRRPRPELASARRRAERSLVRASLLRFARLRGATVVATAETATRCAASAVAAAAAGAGAALPLEVAGCDRRFCRSGEEGDQGRGGGPVSFVRPLVSVPASDVEAAARLLGLTAAAAAGGGEGDDEGEEEQDGVLAAAAEFLGAAQLRVPSTATSVVAALGKLAPCGWAGRRSEDARRSEPPRSLCDLCAAGPWSSGDGAEAEVEVEGEGDCGTGGGDEEQEKKKEKLVLLRLCYPCATVALGAPPAPAGASPVVPRAAARRMAQALFAGAGGGGGGLWGKR
jgi:hypothetical protein